MKHTTIIITSIFLVFLSVNAQAGLDTYAIVAKLVEQLHQLQKQYDLLSNAYDNAQQQLNRSKQLVNDSEGHYGYGNLYNNNADLQQREWSPNTWDNALQGMSGGNPERYQQLLDEYKQNNPTLSQNDYQKGASPEMAKQYQQQINVNRAVSVQSTYAFNDIKKHLQTVHDLSSQIDKSQNTKASIDLNSRLITELAYISIQELKLQALMNQQLAQQQSSVIANETDAAKFNKLPDE